MRIKYLARRLLPAFVLSLVGGYSTFARASESVSSGGASQSAPKPSVESSPARPARFDLHIFGLSYHPDRESARRRKLDNEFNAGLGLSYQFHDSKRGAAFVEAGVYKDSGYNQAAFAGGGYQFKLGEHWSGGAYLLGFDSPTYNDGRFFIAPIPRLAYDFGPATLNAVYAPRYREYNDLEVFALFLSVPLRP